MINFNFAVRMINFNFAVRIPLNLTNHTQGDRKTETVIRLTGAAYKNTSQTKCTNGSRPSAGAVYRVAMIKTVPCEAGGRGPGGGESPCGVSVVVEKLLLGRGGGGCLRHA